MSHAPTRLESRFESSWDGSPIPPRALDPFASLVLRPVMSSHRADVTRSCVSKPVSRRWRSLALMLASSRTDTSRTARL